MSTNRPALHTAATATAPIWSVRVTYGADALTERVRAQSADLAVQALAGFLALPAAAFTSALAQAI